MVDNPDADNRVEAAILERQVVGITEDRADARLAGELRACRLDVRLGGIQQDDLAVTQVLVRQPAVTRSDLHDPISGRRQEPADGDPVGTILVVAVGPEDIAVGEVGIGRDLVVNGGGGRGGPGPVGSHRVGAWHGPHCTWASSCGWRAM